MIIILLTYSTISVDDKKKTPDWSVCRFNGIPDNIFSEAATFAASLKFTALR